ncbi:MAG: ChaN family lipoprotein [Limisphaerales bacterium]
MTRLTTILAVALMPAMGFAEPPPAYRLVQSRTGQEMTLAQVADELAARDVVYFGELHDNVAGHAVYAELAKLLADRRADLVVSMEMFERDVQGVVNDYLRGRIDEAAFLKHGRPWKDYARDYRPLVELARERKLDVIAGNLPRAVAGRVASKEGSTSPFLPRSTTAPPDRYWELFGETMKGHPGAEGAVDRMYRAQCAKDDAMAEAIADYLAANPHRQPLVIHCNGNFHSDHGLGTAARLAQRAPLAQAAIISMVAVPDVAKADVTAHRRKAHYLLVVPEPPKPPEKPAEKKPDEAKPGLPR